MLCPYTIRLSEFGSDSVPSLPTSSKLHLPSKKMEPGLESSPCMLR